MKKQKRRKLIKKRRFTMTKYVCNVCGWEYDEAVGDESLGIAPGTAFTALPDSFTCPLCGVGKEEFSAVG
jgi:rubredoxin-NAD+ reductase